MSNLVQKAYKLRFYPQNDLKIILAKTFGCTRFVYNQTLDYSENHYAQKEILVSQGIDYKNLTNSDRINFIKTLKDSIELDPLKPNYNQLKYPWLKEVSSISLQQSIGHLNDSYSRFFKGQSAKPQFKSKRDNHNSFTITGKNSLHFDKDFNKPGKPGKPGFKKFYLPKYDKPLNMKECVERVTAVYDNIKLTILCLLN
jgi:putative transposase